MKVTFKANAFSFILWTVMLLCFFPTTGMSLEEIVIGQDAVLTTGNIVQISGDADSNGTNAYARVIADPYTSSISQADCGLDFKIAGYENGPNSCLANLTFEFDYSIIVDFSVLPPSELGGGSADAMINAYFFGEHYYDRINFIHNSGTDQSGKTVVLKTQAPVSLQAGSATMSAGISLYAHADVYIGYSALAYASANLKKVEIDFLPPPVAAFSHLPAKPMLGDAITFDASESVCPEGQTCSYLWDFGDTTTGTGKMVNKTFSNVGAHKIVLLVKDEYNQQSTFEKNLTFAPAIYVFPKAWLFTTVKINGEDKPNTEFLPVTIANDSIATADLVIDSIELTENDDDIFQINRDPCSGATIAPGAACPESALISLKNQKEGTARLRINYNSLSGQSYYIPLIHKVYSVETDEEAELVKKMCEDLSQVVLTGSIDPAVMTFPDNISDYEAIGGKEFYFKEGNKESITTDINRVNFSDTLVDKLINADNTIKVLPYTVAPLSFASQMPVAASQSAETQELILIDFLQIAGDSRWFTFVDTIEYDIGGIAIEAFKFVFFQPDGNTATGYSIVYEPDTRQILELTTLFGSTDIKDMTPFKSDADIDIDVDGKNLSAFAAQYNIGDISADLNFDGRTDLDDLKIFASEFGY